MFEAELERKISDFRDIGIPEYVPRRGTLHRVEGMVSTVVGARRAGKSFRVLQAADELIISGGKPERTLRHICHLDFDNPILSTMAAKDLRLIQHTFLRLTPELGLKSPLVFIFDEIHKITNWEEYVVDLSRNSRWTVIVTGSSSKLLRDDVATELRGKAVSSQVYPLSFTEFLRFNGHRGPLGSTKANADARRLFDVYLQWGSYPAVAKLDKATAEVLLREYFDTMLLRDIIQRHNASKPNQCELLYRYLLSNMGKPHTVKAAYQFLKGAGGATSRDAVADYLGWAEDAWLLFAVPIFSDSHKAEERNYKKLYAIDWALAVRNSSVWDGSLSRALENIVYLHLRRRFPRVRYYLTRTQRHEVDFLAADDQGRPVLAVQVCMDIAARDTLARELEPLFATASYFGTQDNLLVTLNQEERFLRDGCTVRAVPAWKWLAGQAD